MPKVITSEFCKVEKCRKRRIGNSSYCKEHKREHYLEVKRAYNKRTKCHGNKTLVIEVGEPICPFCHKRFERTSNRQIFCDTECREAARKSGEDYEKNTGTVLEIEPIPFRMVECKCPRCKTIHTKNRLPEGNGTRPWEYCDECKEVVKYRVNADPLLDCMGDIWEDHNDWPENKVSEMNKGKEATG